MGGDPGADASGLFSLFVQWTLEMGSELDQSRLGHLLRAKPRSVHVSAREVAFALSWVPETDEPADRRARAFGRLSSADPGVERSSSPPCSSSADRFSHRDRSHAGAG